MVSPVRFKTQIPNRLRSVHWPAASKTRVWPVDPPRHPALWTVGLAPGGSADLAARAANIDGPVPTLPHPASGGVYRDAGKRGLDLVLVGIFGLPCLLIILGLAALIMLRDGASPFYRQERIGLGGRRFHMWKLRSMVVDADAKLAAHLAQHPQDRAEWQRRQKLRRDPRVTPLGRLIRRTSLDELPQLWNVVSGDMSLVGPRPMLPDQRPLYPGKAYFTVRPGITGYWQVSVRNESSFAARAVFDTAYCRELSLLTDLAVLTRSIAVVLRGTGC